MLNRSSKMWSDKARAAALAKRRGQAAPASQSATAADAVQKANALIAGGILNKPKAGKGKAKAGKGKPAKPAKPKDARTPQEKTNQNRAQVAKQTGMDDLEGTVSRLGSGMHSDLEKEAHDKLISKGLATRHADGTVTLSPAGKKWKAAADKGDASGANAALTDASAATADSAAKEKTKQTAVAARQQQQQARQADRAKAQATRAKAQAEKAKQAKQKAKAADKAKAEKQQTQVAKKPASTLPSGVVDAATALVSDVPITPDQQRQLVTTGLAKPDKTGALILTPAGRRALGQKAVPMNMTMIKAIEADLRALKVGARNSRTDQQRVDTIAEHAHALGGRCPDCPTDDESADPTKALPEEDAALDDELPADEELEEGDDEEAEGQTGLMIALQVPPDVAAALAIEGEQPPEALHLTLAYLGDADSFAAQQYRILAAVEKVIADQLPLDATIGGVGRFATSEDDGTNAFYASVDCVELADFRQAIIDALADADITIDETHGFTPHITLAYIAAGAPTPPDMPSVTDLTFDTVIVAFGDHQVLFPLGDPVADAAALDAEQGDDVPAMDQSTPVLQAKAVGDDTLIGFGGAVKTIGQAGDALKVGGYLIEFTDAERPDLTRDYFDPKTRTGIKRGTPIRTPIYFNHRLPMKTADGRTIAIKDEIGEGWIDVDDHGVFFTEAVIYNRRQYESLLGDIGWSSGTASHLVDRTPVGKSFHIDRWPLGLDASVTPTPAEPRTRVLPLKSFLAETQPEARVQTARPAVTRSADDDSDMPQLIIIRRNHAI